MVSKPTKDRFEIRLRVNTEQRKHLERKAEEFGGVSLCDIVRWLVQRDIADTGEAQ
jgi:hypothetical protein